MAETTYRPADPSTTFAGAVQAGAANADTPVLVGGSGAVELQAQGDSSNIDVNIEPKGSGVVNIDATLSVDAILGGDASLGITGATGAAAAAGGAIVETGGAGGAGATTSAGGAGGAVSMAGGAGGAKAGTGAAAGGAGGAASVIGGVGGATASSGTDAGGAGGDLAFTAGAGGAASAGTGNGGAGGSITLTPGAGGASAGGSAGVAGVIIERGNKLVKQGTPTAKTVSATLTAAEVLAGIITINQGGGATSAQQLPTASDLDAALPDAAAGDAYDFSVINISTVDAEDASVTTNTGWTLVGSMDIHAYSAAGSLNSSGRFRARKTGSAAWTLYRIS